MPLKNNKRMQEETWKLSDFRPPSLLHELR